MMNEIDSLRNLVKEKCIENEELKNKLDHAEEDFDSHVRKVEKVKKSGNQEKQYLMNEIKKLKEYNGEILNQIDELKQKCNNFEMEINEINVI